MAAGLGIDEAAELGEELTVVQAHIAKVGGDLDTQVRVDELVGRKRSLERDLAAADGRGAQGAIRGVAGTRQQCEEAEGDGAYAGGGRRP